MLDKTTKQLSNSALYFIATYRELNFNDKLKIVCPYYINTSRAKDLRVMVGKGTPDEIIMETKMWAKLKGFNISEADEQTLVDFMAERGIGIDCSGFAYYLLEHMYREQTGKILWRKLSVKHKSFLHRIAYFLRPVEKINVEILTNEQNSKEVLLKDVIPGDVIKSKWKKKNSHHIMVISKVELENGVPTKIEYVHSSPSFGAHGEVRFGNIEITNVNAGLGEQNWLEKDAHGVSHTQEGYLVDPQNNGIRRLNLFIS